MWALLVVFVVAPAALAALVIGAVALLPGAHLPWVAIVQTAVIVCAIWAAAAAILRAIARNR